jgi:UDP-N-acetylglucosamine--N-acetylmuramyl-(pentapeptide) pyrophosphoryl-undecaprenol N-acetylglucosamine transferase
VTSASNVEYIALAAGGTGGHVYPAIAVLQALKQRRPEARILFFGRRQGLEKEALEKFEVDYVPLSICGFPRRPSLRWLSAPLLAIGAVVKSFAALLRRRPKAVIGFGSYVAGPVVLAALLLGIPTIIHEQNAVPGAANRVLAPWVKRVLTASPETGEALKRADAVEVGIPLRGDVVGAAPEPERFGLEAERPVLLIFGGSQGARKICQVATGALKSMASELEPWQVLLVSGPRNYQQVISEPLPEAVVVKDYVHDMGAAYASAKMVFSRAGAVSLAEITANGLPAILVPFPAAAGGHQEINARSLEKRGAARVILDAELNTETMRENILALIRDKQLLERMARASRQAGHPEASGRFLEEIEKVIA